MADGALLELPALLALQKGFSTPLFLWNRWPERRLGEVCHGSSTWFVPSAAFYVEYLLVAVLLSDGKDEL